MQVLKIGARLKSAVCDGEVVVVAAPKEPVALTCGGVPMLAPGATAERAPVNPEHAGGMRIGKRYVAQEGNLEVLCVKAGTGSLGLDGQLLQEKTAKKLPKTD